MKPGNPMRQPEWIELAQATEYDQSPAAQNPHTAAWSLIVAACRDKVERLADAVDREIPIIWYHGGLTPEILMGFDGVEYLPVELYPIMHNLMGNPERTLEVVDEAESLGAGDLCSFLKAAIGAVQMGLYPQPAGMLHVTAPCTSQNGLFNNLSAMTQAPRAVIDIPYHDGEPETRQVVAALQNAIRQMEKWCGRAYSFDRLRAACAESDRARAALVEWGVLLQDRHRPCSAATLAAVSAALVLLSGDARGTRIATGLRDQAAAPATDEPRPTGRRRRRALWLGKPFWGEPDFYDRLETDLDLEIVMDPSAYYAGGFEIDATSEESLLEGLAIRYLRANPLTRFGKHPLEVELAQWRHLCAAYPAEFAILGFHRGCKHDLVCAGAFRSAVRETGLPCYTFEFDLLDPRAKSGVTVREELGRFMADLAPRPAARRGHTAVLTAGIDIGSTTSKAALWQGDALVGWTISPSTTNPAQTARACYETVLAQSGFEPEEVARIVGTGYGRAKVPFADGNTSEISCHGRGAQALVPSVRTVIDIGGQDAKAIAMDEHGRLVDFAMNDKCATGTGKFLEFICSSLGIAVTDLEQYHDQYTGEGAVPLSSMCSVFLESEIINLMNEGVPLPAIVHGLHQAVAMRVLALARRVGIREEIVITGGVAKNRGVVQALAGLLGHPLLALPADIDPQVIGAIGAAVIAQDR